MNPVKSFRRGLTRIRDFRWDMYAQPMRETRLELQEMRLELQIVYFAIHVPFGGGLKVNLPMLTMIRPLSPPDPEPGTPQDAD